LKLQEAIELITSYFKEAKIEVVRHVIRQGEEYFRLRARLDGTVLDVREYWVGNELRLYGYQLLVGDKAVLRYNNAPHHTEVSTFPHHKHIEGRVEELKEANLAAFLNEVKSRFRTEGSE